jgi:chromosome partitioning protein
MAGMKEGCSVCGREFEVQFRYQMEETQGGFSFFCSHDCHGKNVRGEVTGGVACDCCGKRFVVDLVSQVVKVKGGRAYACAEACRQQLLLEAGGARLESFTASPPPVAQMAPAPALRDAPPPPVQIAPIAAAPVPAPAPRPVVAPQPQSITGGAPAASVAVLPRPKRIAGPSRLAIFNHKGGTGKTTTTVSLAAGLAARGLRVLLVDTDSQGNVGVSLGVKLEKSLYHVLVMGVKPEDVVVKVRENLDFIGSNETLAAAELYLAGRQNRDRILRDRLARVSENYDIVMVDCSPSLSLLNQNALVLADGILVPVACDFLSLVGVRQVVKTVKNVNSLLRHPVQIYGVLPTFYDARAKICREAVDTLTEHFGERCLPPIRQATKFKEAPSVGKTIFEYAPDSNAAEDYLRIVDHIISGPAATSATTQTTNPRLAGSAPVRDARITA